MIGKIVKGTSFSGCVNYVLKEDKSRLLKAVGVYGSPEEIAEQFELQTLLNDKVKNTVGHISLSFSVEDGDRIRDDDGLMLKIAHDYMKLMGIENTQFIIARHTDRDHPHCHIVYNRVDNDGRTISDKNDRYRNEKVCKMLTARYRLHFAEGKEHVNFMRLRHHDRVKYFIYHALKREVPNARSWSELRLALRRYGIDTQWKLSRTTGKMQGVKFTCNQQTFSGSKIDRQFSFLNIDQELRYNALSATMNQRHVQVETICEEPRHEYQQENHAGISLGLFTPSPTDYDTEEAIQANRLKKKKKKKKGEEDEPEPTKFLPVNVGAPSSMDVYGSISLNFEEPIASFDTAAIHLRQKVDTLWKDIPFEFEQDSVNLKKFNLYYDWEPTLEYEFSVDSTAFHGIYGLFTDKIKQGFKVRSEDEYFTLHFNVTGADSLAFVELLDAQDKGVRKRRVEEDGMVDFYFLNPGKYAARLINDTNGNGEWDTGDFAKGIQPEAVYYYPTILEYKALWDVTQPWDIHATPVDKQKPDELKKQKPDEDKKKKDRDRNNQNRRR